MFRTVLLGFSAVLAASFATTSVEANDGDSFLNQFRFDKSFDQPKYQRYKKRSRKLSNFGRSSNDYRALSGSGLYFESDRITQPDDSRLRREDQKTQIKLKIEF